MFYSCYKKCFVLAVFAVASLVSWADTTLPARCTTALPDVLRKNIITEAQAESVITSEDWGQSKTAKKYWIAYSDREDNTTYNGPSESSGKFSTLAFNEKVRIAQIIGKYALVYTEKQLGVTFPAISKSAVSRGWVPMSNLLLWSSCPTNDIGIYNKALIVNNLDQTQSTQKQDLFKRYMNPSTRQRAFQLHSTMNFYFVMKKADNGLVLLAKDCKMEGYTSAVLYGWVSAASYVPWDQRTCLEPNWQRHAAENFDNKQLTVWKNSALTTKGSSITLGRKNNVGSASTAYRMLPTEMRYPLLNNDSRNDKLYKLTAFATPSGNAPVPTNDNDNEITIVNDKLKEMSTINLIIVIDGTSSMETYYPAAQQIIQDANKYFGKEDGSNVRVGIVIYRDYTDGQYLTEHLRMTSCTDPNVAAFLQSGGKYGVKSSSADHTLEEALYKGIELGLDAGTMGYSKNNSNLMFVIGDCGNDLNDTKAPSLETLVSKAKANRVQISAFQVRNVNEQAFLLFRKQMGDLVRANLKAQYGALGANVKAGFTELADGYDFKTNLDPKQNFFIGSTRNADLGKDMQLSKLYELVMRSYTQFATAIAAQKGTANNASETFITLGRGSDTQESVSATIDINFLRTIYSEAEIKQLKEAGTLMAFQGYAEKNEKGSDLEYWQPIIYISSDEFATMMEKLQPVMTAASKGSTDRKPYINALKALLRSMVPDITEAEMDEKDVKEVMAMIAGMNASSGSMKGRTFIQLQDDKIVKQDEFDALIADFKNKFNKLKKIRENKYPFSIERNKTTWYWIPVEDLP